MSLSSAVTYSKEIIQIIKNTYSLKDSLSEIEINNYISNLPRIDVMDAYIASCQNKVTSAVIYEAVTQAFKFHLERVPVLTKDVLGKFQVPLSTDFENSTSLPSKIILDLYLAHYNYQVTGAEVRTMINHFFGMNLAGIDGLGNTRISLYSKSQWLVKDEKDLFVIHTGIKDVDVKVYVTSYFTEQTRLGHIPIELQQSLTELGYSYSHEVGEYYYSNPTGYSVTNAFKGKTIDAIVKVTNTFYTSI